MPKRNGAEKLKYVENWLLDRDIKLDTGMIRALIESEVYKLQHELEVVESVVIEEETEPPGDPGNPA